MRMPACLAAIAWCVLAATGFAVGQRQSAAAGAASLAGTIADARSRPLEGVSVMLTHRETGLERAVVTGADGRFAIAGLPAGAYRLTANLGGFVTREYGATAPGQPGTAIRLAADQQLANLVMTLEASGAITGQVFDERGEPLAGLAVSAAIVSRRDARHRLDFFDHTKTDDDGRYRIDEVPPRSPVVIIAMPPRVDPSSPRDDNGPPVVIGPMYAPGVGQVSHATRVELAPGQEAIGIDVRLRAVAATTIHVAVAVSATAFPESVGVTIVASDDPGAALQRSVVVRDARTVHLHGVAAGTYVVRVTGTVDEPEPGTKLWASETVTVDGVTPATITALLVPGARVDGRVVFAGDARPGDWPNVRLVPIDPTMPMALATFAMQAPVGADGTFTMAGIAPGRYVLSVGPAGDGTATWRPGGASIAGRDAFDLPIDLLPTQHITGATITMVSTHAALGGRLFGADGQPRVDLTLVLFPGDERYWWDGTPRVHVVRPDTSGVYEIAPVAPGEYRLAAVTAIDGDVSDPEYLRQLSSVSIGVTIRPGERAVQDVKAGR